MDISAWITNWAESSPNRQAISYESQIITYEELEGRVAHLAAGLADELGVRLGDRVVFLGRNAPELLQVMFACARIGAIFVPLNNRMTAEQHTVFLNHIKPRCMLAEIGFGAMAAKSLAGMQRIPLVLFACAPATRPGERTLGALFYGAHPRSPKGVLAEDRPVLIAYTSGTTGVPKGVLLTHDALFHGAMNSIRAFEMTNWDKILAFNPMSHLGGLAVLTLPALCAGAMVTIHVDFDPARVLREIERSRITLFVARPAASKAITSHSNWDSTDISSLRAVTSGSTHVPLHVMHPWFQKEVPVQQIYGSTEAQAPAIIVPLEVALGKIGSIGRPVLHCKARIVDSEMNDVPPRERGQILLKGRSVFERYWNNPQATKEAFHDGWFLTGDIGHVDKDGYYYFDGRIKDIIVVDSSNVYPEDVERVLAACDAVEAAVVVGRPDSVTGEAIVACVVLKKGYSVTAEQLTALFPGRLAPYQHPKDIILMDAIPYNMSGKVRRGELRKMVAD